MRILDLRQLEYFLRVAQRRNISIAAAELNVAQPTLSKSIKVLERELGVRLFDRLARRVELTDYGQTLLRHAEAVQVQIADASGGDRGPAQRLVRCRVGRRGTGLAAPSPAPCRGPDGGAPSRHPHQGRWRLRRRAVPIDVAPTILDLFGKAVPREMQGHNLLPASGEVPARAAAIFGYFGGAVNVTDGRYT